MKKLIVLFGTVTLLLSGVQSWAGGPLGGPKGGPKGKKLIRPQVAPQVQYRVATPRMVAPVRADAHLNAVLAKQRNFAINLSVPLEHAPLEHPTTVLPKSYRPLPDPYNSFWGQLRVREDLLFASTERDLAMRDIANDETAFANALFESFYNKEISQEELLVSYRAFPK